MTEEELLGLPVSVDLQTAGRAIGLSKNTTYRRVREGTFPFPVINTGRKGVVPKAAILTALGIDPSKSLASTSDPNAVTPLATASDH